MFLAVGFLMPFEWLVSEEAISAGLEETDGAQRAVISMESYKFTPHEIVAQVGIPLELTLQNDSFLVPHNFLLDSPDGKRLMEVGVASGESQNVHLTFTEPGIYPFYCDKQLWFFPSHREQGMEGRIIVR